MILDIWFGKNNKIKCKVATPKFPREKAENILATLLIKGILKEDFHFTPYSTISYMKAGIVLNFPSSQPAYTLTYSNHSQNRCILQTFHRYSNNICI